MPFRNKIDSKKKLKLYFILCLRYNAGDTVTGKVQGRIMLGIINYYYQ